MSGPSAGEHVEWVDEHGGVIAIVPRAQMRAENLRHRSVAVIVRSRTGRVLVQRRASTKDLLPGWWDIGAGGVVGVGETFDAAARRELAEELGVTDAVLEPLGSARHDDDHSREICRVYAAVHDGPFEFADGEVAEARWVDEAGFAELARAEPFLPGSLAIVLPHLPGFVAPAG